MRATLGSVIGLLLAAGCAATKSPPPDGGAGLGGASGLDAGVDGASDAGQAMLVLPPIPDTGYPPGDLGGYLLGPPLAAAEIQHTLKATSSAMCNRLRGVVRDFKGALPAVGGTLEPGGHPDFEVFQGETPTTGLVGPDLDQDERKPRYASLCELGSPDPARCPYGAMTTTAKNFGQWYTSVEGVNKTFLVYFELSGPDQGGTWTFASDSFFPVDDHGWGNSGVVAGHPRNFSFTTEIHTTFRYNGGEIFTFNGDDDVWIFVNGKLAVDLGGLHHKDQGSVDLDTAAAMLGMHKGAVYELDLFHAERHSVESHFQIQLNFAFQDCGYIVP